MLKFIRIVAVISTIFGIISFLASVLMYLNYGRESDAIFLVALAILLGTSLITLALLEQNK
jgi:hypothetical protein